MSFVQPQTSTSRLGIGVVVAVLFHIALVWALMSGLGQQILQVVKAPIETKLIEEVKPPPPPPKVIEMPPPPKFSPPPPSFVPPPEVKVQAPSQQPTITATTAEPPPPAPQVAPRVEAPPAPSAPQAPPPAVPVSAAVACPNYSKVMSESSFPRDAQRAGLEEGSALIQFTLGANGEIKDVKSLQASHQAFARGAMRIVGEYKCAGQGRDVTVQVPFAFKSN
jgi:periplasmic protein TonB